MAQPNGYYNYKGKREDVLVCTANYTVQPHLYECGNFSNRGAGGEVIITLPPALPGRTHTFHVETAQLLAALPQSGEFVCLSTGVPNTVDVRVRCNTVGASITWECVTRGVWNTKKAVGTWATA